MAETAANHGHSTTKDTQEMVLAQQQAAHGEGSIIDKILHSNVFNFLVVIVFLVLVARKIDLPALIAKKQNEIAELINNAEDEKKIKQNHLSVTKNKVSNVKEEVIKIINEGEHVANNLSENIREDAKKYADDLHKKALISVDNEKQMVAGEVEAKISKAAFYIAEEHIKQAIDDRLQKKFIDEFIDNLDKIHN